MKTAIVPALCILLITTGCTPARLSTRTLEAEERVITAVDRKIGKNSVTERIVCPEPSPDALKTIAASASASKQNIAAIAATYGESAANIGLRTHSIQLLRDQLFSICQAYANGAISPNTYKMYLTRNQRNTVAIMAIEQLTGIAHGPNVVLASSSSADQGRDLLEQTKQLNDAEQKYAALDAKTDEAKNLRTTIDALKLKLEQDRASLVSTSASAVSNAVPVVQLSPDALGKVASSVENIAKSVIDVNDFFYLCFDSYADESTPDELKAACKATFHGSTTVKVDPTESGPTVNITLPPTEGTK
ncbi:hypothetical protein MCB86_22100 [Pseudomonas sp. KSR10]|uniref:hypothetical protein n=1 Tax=Pseudomonas sp. KSR10 TaxID=2916654 RepID=UPI001EF7877C|nr:hypothetical protein [Pseudomonas sp. KSR10]MCG6542772.1 hypothetical protein [Pseudomonas sp. KSR10]